MSKFVNEVNDSQFEKEVLQSQQPVLVDFYASWCGPCRALAPTVDKVAEENAGNVRVVKVNVDDSPSTAGRFKIKGIPTLVLFKNGKEAERIVGAVPKEEISRLIESNVDTVKA